MNKQKLTKGDIRNERASHITLEELEKIPFKCVAHLSAEYEHCSTYENKEYGIAYCVHTPYKNGEPHGRTYTHYMYKNVIYKSVGKLLEAINNLNE